MTPIPGRVKAVPETNTVYKPAAAQLAAAKAVIRANRFNSGIAFLIDMKRAASQNRFFVYDLNRDSIIAAGLVTHGRCGEKWLEGRRYSNTVGSMCTSLGNYRIGNPYQGRFGLAYKLYGLDSSNSNAFERYVVLHSHACVPEAETDYEICQSDGCPTVSPGFLKQLQAIIDASPRPILLSIYESQ
ncbi:murein L,D-transpeptidase catalytic domain family protein [Niabella sp. 3A5MI-3]|nr:murein L,D-transpeptidase catalytic domain family protein [Niabella beijingensis]